MLRETRKGGPTIFPILSHFLLHDLRHTTVLHCRLFLVNTGTRASCFWCLVSCFWVFLFFLEHTMGQSNHQTAILGHLLVRSLICLHCWLICLLAYFLHSFTNGKKMIRWLFFCVFFVLGHSVTGQQSRRPKKTKGAWHVPEQIMQMHMIMNLFRSVSVSWETLVDKLIQRLDGLGFSYRQVETDRDRQI